MANGRIDFDLPRDEARAKLPPILPDSEVQAILQRKRQLPPAETGPVLEVADLTFAYGDNAVLRGVNLNVKQGELVALMGRNGSGKSTLLRCLVGLLIPDGGDARIDGQTVRGRRTVDISRDTAYLPQNPDDLLFADSVLEELAITLRNHGRQPEDENGRTLLNSLGLAKLAGAYPRDLSVGQRQRVALGAVIVTGPNLLLLDEPTRGLDAGAKAAMVDLWLRLRQAGMGILLVTHDRTLVAGAADRLITLADGRITGPNSAIPVESALD